MKNKLIAVCIAACSTSAWAHRVGNGGDICESRIETVRDDISSWIGRGDSSQLSFPGELSASVYNQAMRQQILSARISCTDDVIKIGAAEKTCMNLIDDQGIARIICNVGRFMNQTSESDQYVLVHHEYAGLAGFEANNGEESQYFISNQISKFLVDTMVKKLGIRKRSTQSDNPPPALELHCNDQGFQSVEIQADLKDFPAALENANVWTYYLGTVTATKSKETLLPKPGGRNQNLSFNLNGEDRDVVSYLELPPDLLQNPSGYLVFEADVREVFRDREGRMPDNTQYRTAKCIMRRMY